MQTAARDNNQTMSVIPHDNNQPMSGRNAAAALAAHYAKELAKAAGKEAIKRGEKAVREYLAGTTPPAPAVSTTSAPTAAPTRNAKRRADSELQRVGAKQKIDDASVVQANAAVTQAATVAVREPKVTTSKDGSSKRVKHRELITFVNAPSTGIADEQLMYSAELNPGSGTMGAWLERESSGWEQYTVHSASAIWVPAVGTSTNGVLAIIPDYDPTDPAPASMADASAFQNSTFFPVHQVAVSLLDAKAMMQPGPRKFVRDPGTVQHKRTSDCGALYVFSRGLNTPSDTLLGSLWLEYDVTFNVPHVINPEADLLEAPITVLTTRDTAQTFAATHQLGGVGVEWFDFTTNNLGVKMDVSDHSLILPRGLYYVEYTCDITVNGSFTGVGTGYVGLTGSAVDNFIRISNGRVYTTRRSGGGSWIANELLEFHGSGYVFSRGADRVKLGVEPAGSAGTVTVQATRTDLASPPYSETMIMITRVDAD